ncbi:MAG: tubulin-like doman-containing protein [Chloroflexota bacterium]|nr:tubulin-like doman-containing protein [Chloroflexota bacterium]
MSHVRSYNSAIQLVGLGGAGVNIVESFINNRKGLIPLLKKEGFRMSCLAIDVADHDIQSLEVSAKDLSEELREQGIPSDKISVTAKSVKFPTPESMFDFINKYPEYLSREGVTVPENYQPWLGSSTDIPPLAGGVGRRRALSKAIYGLNYHHLRLLDNYMDGFKEHVFTSTIQPVIFVIYGLGGGSGSGMVMDFTRHLRRKVGSGVPIIGLCVLPCTGDDPPAKGTSAYSAITENGLLIDKQNNANIIERFGSTYENPFSGFLVMPLGPAYSKTANLIDAKLLIDDAVVDILMNSLNFDLADLLSNIGANLDMDGKWLHVLSTIKVSYPVTEFIELTRIYLEKLDKIRALRREKKEVYGGTHPTEVGGVSKILNICYQDLREVYRQILIEKGSFSAENFDEAVNNLINADRSLEADYIMHLKGVDDSIKAQVDELKQPVMAIGLGATEGTMEALIREQSSMIINLASCISKNYNEFLDKVDDILDNLRDSLPSAQQLTAKEGQLVSDVLDLASMIRDYLVSLRLYLETKKLSDKLQKQLLKSERSEEQQLALTKVERIINPELVVLFSLLSSMFTPSVTQLKGVDSLLVNCRRVRRVLEEEIARHTSTLNNLELSQKAKQVERNRAIKEAQEVKLKFIFGNKKKLWEEKAKKLDHALTAINEELSLLSDELTKVQEKMTEYSSIERRFEVNSDYRKLLASITEMANEHYEKMNEMVRDKGFYDRTAELTEDVQLRLMQRILMEDEASLSHETILRDIIDKDHLKEYLASVLGIFRVPGVMGLTQEYKTDYIWFAVVSPRGIWDHDLAADVRATLSGYVKEDASRSIAIREIDSTDPWTVRFMVIAAKAEPGCLECFQEMKQIYDQTTPDDRTLSHSFLLEHGIYTNVNGESPRNSSAIIKATP